MRLTRGLLLTLPLVAQLTLGGVHAQADDLGSAGDLRYKSSTGTIPADTSFDPTETKVSTYCNKGWKAISGGITVPYGFPRAIASTTLGGNRPWYSRVWQEYDIATTVVGYAVCLRTQHLDTVTTSIYDLPTSGGQVTDVAYCTDGYVVGGGLRAVGDAWNYSLNASYPVDSPADQDTVPDDGWRVYTEYDYGADGDTVLVDAVCLDEEKPAYRSETVTSKGSSRTKLKVACPDNRRLIGGGVYMTGASELSHVISTRPWDSKDDGKVPEDGWRGVVSNDSHSDLEMTVHAICR